MIAVTSIWAVVLRYARLWRRDINILLGTVYWPLLDILIWGFLGKWIQQAQVAQFNNYETVALLGILLWQIVGRGCVILGFMFTEELLSNNMVNLFSLPLRIIEWAIGMILFYGAMMLVTFSVCMLFVWLLYDASFMQTLSTFFIFMPPLLLSGIWVGFTALQIITLLGKRGMELGFVAGWFLLPFCGAYYPIEVLPAWGQTLSKFLPMTYVFQGMRGYVMHHQDPTAYLIKASIMSIAYAACAVAVFIYCFNRSKKNGLARLAD